MVRNPTPCASLLATAYQVFLQVRIIIKGGVWRNTEDEILKAAISKYGKNVSIRAVPSPPRPDIS